MNKDIEFSELMTAKFCHDLSGPIGAVSNSIDFLDSSNADMRKKAVELVQFSSNQAVNRIMFLRQAYGVLPPGADSSLSVARDLINRFAEGSKLVIKFTAKDTGGVIEGSLCKLLLNMVVILSAIMMSNGKLDVTLNKQSAYFSGTSSSYNIDKSLIDILKGKNDDKVTTRTIQYFYTYHIAKEAGYTITMDKKNDKIAFNLVKK
jgi:histidine phosphotransferase ChpT